MLRELLKLKVKSLRWGFRRATGAPKTSPWRPRKYSSESDYDDTVAVDPHSPGILIDIDSHDNAARHPEVFDSTAGRSRHDISMASRETSFASVFSYVGTGGSPSSGSDTLSVNTTITVPDRFWSQPSTSMSFDVTRRAVDTVASYLNSTWCPYFVYGLSAMQCYGFEGRRADCVTINIPDNDFSKKLLMGLNDMDAIGGRDRLPHEFAIRVPLPMRGGKGQSNVQHTAWRQVKVKPIKDFEFFDTARLGPASASVLTLPALINLAAGAWMEREGDHDSQKIQAEDIEWLLNQSIKYSSSAARLRPEVNVHRIREGSVPFVVHEDFWGPFTERHANMVDLFWKAGLSEEEVRESIVE